jgi:RHS repeat-associated protein/uncharacterized repeat protein (TIGR01451 family)
MLVRLVRFFPALAALVLATLLLFIPPFIESLSYETEVSAGPLMQGEPTPEPTPDPIPTPEDVVEVTIDLTADQPQIEAGGTITYTVMITNTTDEAVGDMVLSSTLPPSTTFVTDPNSPVTYNPLENSVTWDAGDVAADTVLTATYQIQADSAAIDTLLLAEVEATSPDLTETLESWEINAVGEIPADEMWLTPEGGMLKSASKPVSVIVNSEGITEALYFQIGASSAETTPSYIWSAFDLTATNKNDEVVTTFPTSLTIGVNLSEYMTTAIEMTGTPSLYWLNENNNEWELVPSTMDWGAGWLQAQVSHFSTFGFGSSSKPSYGAQHLPTIDGFSNNEWSGNSQINYPLVLPPAPGNIPFGLALTYSSEGVNSLLGMETSAANGQIGQYHRQASTIGWGWNLAGLGQVSRNLGDERLFANFGGGNFEIIRIGTNEWQTEPQTFVKIIPETGIESTKFRILTQDGITYTFGSDNWGNGVAWGFTLECRFPPQLLKRTMREAYLTQIEDSYNNRVEIIYATETRSWDNGCANSDDYVQAIRPTEINYYPAASGGISTVKIVFHYDNLLRTDDVVNGMNPQVQSLWSAYNLWGIEVQVNNGGWQTARRYKLEQAPTSGTDNAPLLILNEIRDYGVNPYNGVYLPANTFSYTRLEGAYKNTTVLQRAHNGYGGKILYGYGNNPAIDIVGCEDHTNLFVEGIEWYETERYFVKQMDIGDGMSAFYGTTTTTTIQITPTSPFVHGEDINRSCQKDFQFGGYGTVEREVKQSNGSQFTSYQLLVNRYHTNAGWEVSSAAGLLYNQQHFDPVTHNALSKLETSYELNGSAYGTDWIYKKWQRETITGTSGIVTHQTNYLYDMAHQKNQQFGRITHATEYVNNVPVRRQETYYTVNNVAGIFVVRPYQQQIFEEGVTRCQGESRYYYDGNNTLGAYLTRGELDKTSVSTQNVTSSNNCDANTATMYTLFDYDVYGRQNKITDARGGVTDITYDTVLHVYPRFIDKPDVNGYRPTVEYIWDYKIGQVEYEKDVDNNVQTYYQYDEWGRTKNIFPPLGGRTYIDYFDDTGQAIVLPYKVETRTDTSTTPHQIYEITYIDGLGRTIENKSTYVNPANTVEHVVGHTFYHPLGGVAMTYAPKAFPSTSGGTHGYILPSAWGTPYISTVAYDALGRPVTETAPDGTTTTHTYDVKELYAVPMTTHHVNVANQNRTLSYTDGLGRLRGVEERNASEGLYTLTRYEYDIADRLTDVYDHFGNHTEVEYDLAGRKTRMDDPDMGEWFYRYNRLGELKAQVDAASNGTCFNYDTLGRPVAKVVYDNVAIGTIFDNGNPNASCPLTGATITENVSNLYDSGSYGKGRLYSVTDLSGDSTTYTYDARGRVTTELETIRYLTTNYTFRTSFEYDILDRVRKITYPADTSGTNTNGEQVHYDYDTQRQLNLTGVRLIANGVTRNLATNMTYNQYGQVKGMSYGTTPALNQTYNYFDLDEVNGIGRLESVATANLWTLNYTYDAVGNVMTINSQYAASSQMQTFGYDFLNRLTSASAPGPGGGYSESYTYNQIGNMMGKAGVSYTYPTAGSDRPHAVSSLSNGKSYTYDAVGNMETRSTGSTVDNTFVYDNENRLKQILLGDHTSLNYIGSYGYNGQGERVFAHTGGERTLYPNAYVEFQLDGVGPSGTRIHYYYVGTQRLAMKDGSGNLFFFVNDHLGSTSLTLNSNGGVYAEQRYKPYGETRHIAYAGTPTRRQYTGQINDIGTGLYFYNARYYDPALGRFTQADTIVPEPGNPQTLNRFSYVNNNPIKYTDPTGHEAEPGSNEGGDCDDWCWQNKWYNAHGYYWNNDTGLWDDPGPIFIANASLAEEILGESGMTFEGGGWTDAQKIEVATGVADLARAVGGAGQLKKLVGGYAKFYHPSASPPWTSGNCPGGGACALPPPFMDGHSVYFRTTANITKYDTVHELAHVIDWNSNIQYPIWRGGIVTLASGSFSNAWTTYTTDYSKCPLNTGANLCVGTWERWAEGVSLFVYGADYYHSGARALEPWEWDVMNKLLQGHGW